MKLGQLTNEIVGSSEESVLVDFQEEGAPLVITFGFYSVNEPPSFGYYGRLKKLESISGRKINKILVRDKKYKWYHYGIEGIGNDVMEVTYRLHDIAEKMAPSKVFTLGQSMGGYAAIMYGALLQVDKILAFGPLSCFQSNKLELMRDYRWMSLVQEVESSPPNVFVNDLVELLRNNPVDTDLFYGIFPGHVDRTMAVNLDAVHMMMYCDLPQVQVYPFHEAEHPVSDFLRRTKVLDDVLLNRIFGINLPAYSVADSAMNEILDPEWINWLFASIKAGSWSDGIFAAMVDSGFDKEVAWRAIECVTARVNLIKYFRGQNG